VHRGYVKLWRKSENSPAFQDPDLWKLWCLCLMKASHKHTFVSVDGMKEPVELFPGQFVTGRYSLHADYYPKRKRNQKSPYTIWRWLDVLQNMENLSIKTCNKFSIVSITNWDSYQCESPTNEQQNAQIMSSRRATDEHKQECKKNVKNKTSSANADDFDAFWSAYPKKRDKGSALKAWKKINGTRPPIATILESIKKQKQSADWTKDNGQFIPYPATWLNGQRWEDEIEVVAQQGPPYYEVIN